MSSRVEIIERRRLRVGEQEFDLASLAPADGGATTREIDAAPGGAEIDESVVLGLSLIHI